MHASASHTFNQEIPPIFIYICSVMLELLLPFEHLPSINPKYENSVNENKGNCSKTRKTETERNVNFVVDLVIESQSKKRYLTMKPNAKHSSKTILTNSQQSNYAIQITRVIFQMIGLWPISKAASIAERIALRLLNVSCFFMFAFILVPGLLLVFLKERGFKRRFGISGPLITCSLNCMKYILLLYHSNKIRTCLELVEQGWQDTVDYDDRKIMLSKAKIGRKLTIFSAAFMYISGLSYRTIVPLSKGRMLTPMNTTVRALASPSYFVKFDVQTSPAYEIVFTLQFFAGLLAYSVSCGAAGLAASLIMYVCGQLAVLINKFQRFNNMREPEDRTVANLLADIVEHQIKVKR